MGPYGSDSLMDRYGGRESSGVSSPNRNTMGSSPGFTDPVGMPNRNNMPSNPYGLDQNLRKQLGAINAVDPSQLSTINLQAPSFGARQSQALSDIERQSASGLAGAQTSLAQSGGLSAADRMALASQFNRDKMMGRQGAMSKYAGMEEAAALDADKAEQMFNANILNQNLYATQDAKNRALDRLIAESQLQRQLKASGSMADAQAKAASKPGGLLGGSIIPGIL